MCNHRVMKVIHHAIGFLNVTALLLTKKTLLSLTGQAPSRRVTSASLDLSAWSCLGRSRSNSSLLGLPIGFFKSDRPRPCEADPLNADAQTDGEHLKGNRSFKVILLEHSCILMHCTTVSLSAEQWLIQAYALRSTVAVHS